MTYLSIHSKLFVIHPISIYRKYTADDFTTHTGNTRENLLGDENIVTKGEIAYYEQFPFVVVIILSKVVCCIYVDVFEQRNRKAVSNALSNLALHCSPIRQETFRETM